MAASPVLISCCAAFIHSPPSLARGTSINRLPDSVSATAALRMLVHSSSVFGRMSSVPLAVTIVLTDSHTTSAIGSTTACISSLLSATALNGGGSGPPPQPAQARTIRETTRTFLSISAILSKRVQAKTAKGRAQRQAFLGGLGVLGGLRVYSAGATRAKTASIFAMTVGQRYSRST